MKNTPEKIKNIIIKSIQDYDNKSISIYELSEVGNKYIKNALYDNWKDAELMNIVELVADLSYYNRNTDKKTLEQKIKTLKDYADNN